MTMCTSWGRALVAALAAIGLCSAAMGQTGACCNGTTCTATTAGCSGANTFILGGACTPNACAGACCSSTGTCSLTAQGSCTGTSTFLGLGSVCTPSTICNQYLGACCSNIGVCTSTMAAGCASPSVFQGFGVACSTGLCVANSGPCCATSGACTLTLPSGCTAPSNFGVVGNACTPTNPCTIPSGACCSATGVCAVKPASGSGSCGTGASVAVSSLVVGSGPTAGVITVTTTNPNTFVSGQPITIAGATPAGLNGTFAITVVDSTHFTYASATTGTVSGTITAAPAGESYQGNGTTCGASTCSALVGGCCATTGACSTLTITGCAAVANQTFQGVGTTCASAPCLTGACCAPSGACALTVASGCGLAVSNFGLSTYLGNGSTCTSGVCFTQLGSGACCPNGTNACTLTTPNGCGTAQFATYQGNNTTCSPTDPCAALRGACCSTAGVCSSTVALGCNGVFGGVGSVCTPAPGACFQVVGACCSSAGFCSVTTGTGCTGANSFRGAGSSCFPDPCAALRGACCSGTGACTITTSGGCTVTNAFQGVGTACTSNPCTALIGACCSSLGACSRTTAAGCGSPSVFQQAGTSCSPNPCSSSQGACCDFNAFTCTQTTSLNCAGANVTWIAATACVPTNPCTNPTGACCIGTTCSAGQDPGFCVAVGGVAFIGQPCSPTPCVRPQIVISQIFPAGGETGSPLAFDYVELFNRGTTDVTMTNWTIQFGAQSTQTFPQRAIINGTILAGHYFLVQLASQNVNIGTPLPVAPDLVSNENVNLDVTAGRLALVSSANQLPSGCPQPLPVNIVDFVGYGNASGANTPTCSEGGSPTGNRGGNIYAFFRKANGCQDSDSNGQDFTQPLPPNPRNSSFSYVCGSTAQGACCNGEICSISDAASCPSAPAGFVGEGTSCSPTNMCLAPKGSCCNGSACTFVVQASCVTPAIYSFGRACNPDPCSGACCTGAACVLGNLTTCTGVSYFQAGVACSPGACPTPVAVQSGDIAYGASVLQNQDAVQQIRGAGSNNPTRVGTWTRYNNLQIMRFDNAGGVLHSSHGNLLGMDFGTVADGGRIFNLPTNGDAAAGSTLFSFSGPTSPFGLVRSRLGGLSVSPNNDRIACIGYDQARLYVMSYDPGATIGTGAGGSVTGGAQTDNTSFVFGFNITQGTGWLDNDHVLMWVQSDVASVLKIFSVPVVGTGATLALGAPEAKITILDNKPNTSRFMSMAYNPQLIPNYIFLGSSAFGGVSLNTLYIVDISQPTWQLVKTIDLGTSLQTEREVAIGPDRNLYVCQFAGAGQQATDPLIDRIVLDANGDGVVTPAEIAALTDNSSVDFYLKGQANTSSFNALDIALARGACCAGQSCSLQPPNFCSGTHGVYQGDGTTCGAGACAPQGVCCRGSTCTSSITTAADCSASITSGTAGAAFASGLCGTSPSTPCCYANYNKANGITVQDIFDFLADWFSGSPFAKVGGNGSPAPLAVSDIFNFLSDWFSGGCQ